MVRSFRICDSVIIAGEDDVVEDVATLFTLIRKADNTRVFIPNNTIIGGKIYLKSKT